MILNKKRDFFIWLGFLSMGIVLQGIVLIDALPQFEWDTDLKLYSYAWLYACETFAFYFVVNIVSMRLKSFGACLLFICQIALVLQYIFSYIVLEILAVVLPVAVTCVIYVHYKNINKETLCSKDELKAVAHAPLFTYNTFAGCTCLVGLSILWRRVIERFWIAVLIAGLFSITITVVRQICSRKYYLKPVAVYIWEIAFIVVQIWLSMSTLLWTDTYSSGFCETCLCIVILASSSFIFERPYFLSKIRELFSRRRENITRR